MRAKSQNLNTFTFMLNNLSARPTLLLNTFLNVFDYEKEFLMYVASCYFSYLAISIALTIWVARTLHSSGRIFLLNAFGGNAELADSVNRLLVVGFYLVNLGYVTLFLQTYNPLQTLRQVIELESAKLGAVLLVLGVVHFVNILILAKMRRSPLHAPLPAAG